MAGVHAIDFDSPDETRTRENTRVEVVRWRAARPLRFTFEPGWKWSECIQPVARTETCQNRHGGYVQSGELRVAHDDGTQLDLGPGEAYVIEPGDDAWVPGDERVVAFEFEQHSAEQYART